MMGRIMIDHQMAGRLPRTQDSKTDIQRENIAQPSALPSSTPSAEILNVNNAIAVNYSFPFVDRFISDYPPSRISSKSTGVSTLIPNIGIPNHGNNGRLSPDKIVSSQHPANVPSRNSSVKFEQLPSSTGNNQIITHNGTSDKTPAAGRPKRQSAGKLREIAREKNRVRYDMNRVMPVQRNSEFLAQFRFLEKNEVSKRCSRKRQLHPQPQQKEVPGFADENSVIWVPSTRSEWDDTISELTSVCTAAGYRRYVASSDNSEMPSTKPGSSATKPNIKPFIPPLSRDYIRDRIDIDDPLRGYQIRHKTGGWLQGFIMWTPFTTWTHYFKWDSRHPKCGIKPITGSDGKSAVPTENVDFDGTISTELEQQHRSGDPLTDGVVWDTLAEISLLGGLGCGEYLLRMALDEIIRTGRYKFVVLQATDTSRPFYEKFGFVRVGAVTKYGSKEVFTDVLNNEATEVNLANVAKKQGSQAQVVGYRHWTYANESSTGLNKHGGPSYMMALKLDSFPYDPQVSILDKLSEYFVEEKPQILQISVPSTLSKKAKKDSSTQNLMGLAGASKGRTSNKKKRPVTPTDQVLSKATPDENILPDHEQNSAITSRLQYPHSGQKRIHADDKTAGTSCAHRNKRMRTCDAETLELATLTTPPPEGQTLNYFQKQYQSVWLAVPPASSKGSGRKPPRPRGDFYTVTSQEEIPLHLLQTPSTGPNSPESVTNVIVQVKTSSENKKRERVLNRGTSSMPSSTESKKRILRKQKITHIVRNDPNKVYFYNKVVMAKRQKEQDGNCENEQSSEIDYYFVLHYTEEKETIRIIPLVKEGVFIGLRAGRTRYKADMSAKETENESPGDSPQGTIITVPAKDYTVVPTYQVTKSGFVNEESWDVLD